MMYLYILVKHRICIHNIQYINRANMQDFRFINSTYDIRSSIAYDEGLRKYFLKIYSLMSAVLII